MSTTTTATGLRRSARRSAAEITPAEKPAKAAAPAKATKASATKAAKASKAAKPAAAAPAAAAENAAEPAAPAVAAPPAKAAKTAAAKTPSARAKPQPRSQRLFALLSGPKPTPEAVKALLAAGEHAGALRMAEFPLTTLFNNRKVPEAAAVAIARVLIAAGSPVGCRADACEDNSPAGVDICDYYGSKTPAEPLHAALRAGYASAVPLLLDAGAEPDSSYGTGPSALACAIDGGSVAALEALLTPGRRAPMFEDLGPGTGQMPPVTRLIVGGGLSHATSAKMLAVLLRAGADPNAPCGEGVLPLQYAVDARRGDCVKALLDAGAIVNAGPDYHNLKSLRRDAKGCKAALDALAAWEKGRPAARAALAAENKKRKALRAARRKAGEDFDSDDDDDPATCPLYDNNDDGKYTVERRDAFGFGGGYLDFDF